MSIEEDHPQTPNAPATIEPDDDELWDSGKVRAYFGGNKPLHISTLYRGICTGIYPPPINVSPNVVRWLPGECREARQRMIAARDQPKPKPAPRGRKRGASAAKAKTATETDDA